MCRGPHQSGAVWRGFVFTDLLVHHDLIRHAIAAACVRALSQQLTDQLHACLVTWCHKFFKLTLRADTSPMAPHDPSSKQILPKLDCVSTRNVAGRITGLKISEAGHHKAGGLSAGGDNTRRLLKMGYVKTGRPRRRGPFTNSWFIAHTFKSKASGVGGDCVHDKRQWCLNLRPRLFISKEQHHD
jgi:hypothetical protein